MDVFLLLGRRCFAFFRGENSKEYVEATAKVLWFYLHVKSFIHMKAPECHRFMNCVDAGGWGADPEKARVVYANEPCNRLREYIRKEIKREGIANVPVLDGFVTEFPYEDSTFDMVTCGHIIDDFYGEEIAECT